MEPLKHKVQELDPVALGLWTNLGRDEDKYLSSSEDSLCLGISPQVIQMFFGFATEKNRLESDLCR